MSGSVTDMLEHRALDRLADFEARWRLGLTADPRALRHRWAISPASMACGPSPSIAVIFYHAGFGWMHGGFLGVEVFFVVSGFLITSLLLEETAAAGGVRLRAVLDAPRSTAAACAVHRARSSSACGWRCFGSAQQQSDLHRDYLPGIFYFANWGQILGGAQYFGNFSPLRHLWSLAVEEQWYSDVADRVRVAHANASAADMHDRTIDPRRLRRGDGAHLVAGIAPTALTSDRINLLYLSTFTRS